MYGFVASTDRNIIEKNVTLSRDLKKKFAFTYAVRFYPICLYIYSVFTARNGCRVGTRAFINTPFSKKWSTNSGSEFSNKKDDGIKFSEVYKPFPKVAFALILTAVGLH